MTEEINQTDAPQAAKSETWQVKEALIAIPFVASALAMTWEVGFFVGIKGGAFGLFTVSEHITYALQALPIAFVVALILVGQIFQFAVLDKFLGHRIKVVSERLGKSRWNFLIFTLSLMMLVLSIFIQPIFVTLRVLAMISVLVSLGLVVPVWRIRVLSIGAGVLAVFIITFGIGIDTATKEINSSRPLNEIRIGEKGKEIEAKILVRILGTGGVASYISILTFKSSG